MNSYKTAHRPDPQIRKERVECIQWKDSIDVERQAYLDMHPALKTAYLGHHVAIYQGKLIDHDVDGVALSRRIDKCYPDQFVLMRQVETEPERVLYFRSPRFVESIL